MLISNKQHQLIKNFYCQIKVLPEYDKISFDDFVFLVCMKSVSELSHQDISTLKIFVERYCPASKRQIDYILEIMKYNYPDTLPLAIINDIIIDDKIECISQLRKCHINLIILHFSNLGFIPQKISKLHSYKILKQTKDYSICEQTHIRSQKALRVLSFRNLLVCDWDNMTLTEIRSNLKTIPYTFLILQNVQRVSWLLCE
jgi:hypothetical protein